MKIFINKNNKKKIKNIEKFLYFNINFQFHIHHNFQQEVYNIKKNGNV